MHNKYIEIASLATDAPFRAQQKPLELGAVLEILAQKPPKLVVEIGTYKGGTIRAFSQVAASDAVIVGVDLPGGEFGGGWSPEEHDLIKGQARPDQRIDLLPLDSHDKATFDKVKAYGKIDFLFIDGDHTYEGFKKDFDQYSTLVKKGGYIGIHDIATHTDNHPDVEVSRYWEEIKKANKFKSYQEFIDYDFITDHGLWGGIGLIQV